MYFLRVSLFLLIATFCFAQEPSPRPKWKAFTVEQLLNEREDFQRPYLRFLDESSISAGLYVLEPGATDSQSPHGRDEVYYVLDGQALLKIRDEHVKVKPGSIVYVRAEVPHRFLQIAQPLRIVVLFSKAAPGASPDFQLFQVQDLQKEGKAVENVWNAFLDVPTMQFGLYQLPKEVGGDRTLVHNVDEVNIVVDGRGKFKIGEDEIDVAPGSIVFVRQGVGHYFHSIKENLDILILFHKKN